LLKDFSDRTAKTEEHQRELMSTFIKYIECRKTSETNKLQKINTLSKNSENCETIEIEQKINTTYNQLDEKKKTFQRLQVEEEQINNNIQFLQKVIKRKKVWVVV